MLWLFLVVTALSIGRGAVLDGNFTESVFVGATANLSAPTGMEFAPDGSNRLFIIRKAGEVRIVLQNGTILPTPFATEPAVFTNSECGLIGMAFDPGFSTNGYVYFFVTISISQQQIVRYTATGNLGANRTVLVPGLPTLGNNHDGGAVAIGPDGKLYWAIGDLGNGTGVDLNISSLAAKVGRANRDGTVPNDNPFIDGAGANNDYIWAGGFRNPYTFTFQPGTGLLWVNCVGTGYEQVFLPGRGDNAGYNDYENNQPAGASATPYVKYITPTIKYRTNGVDVRNIVAGGAVRSGNVTTLTTNITHGFRQGERITVAGVTNATFNGSFHVASVPSNTTFTYAQTGPNATSGNGSTTTLRIGGGGGGAAITGGTFLDTSAVPAIYRGNYFFGDYVGGNIIRSILNGSNQVTSVDHFANAVNSAIDMAVGPDGALYSVRNDGRLTRWAYNQGAQALLVTPLNQRTDEGSQIACTVRLAVAPTGNVTVNTTRTAGDADLTVAAGASLTFTNLTWSIPQPVRLAAAEDADATNDTATFSFTSTNLTTENATLTVLDNDAPELVVSTAAVALAEGGGANFTVSLSGPPSIPTLVNVTRTAGDTNITVTSNAVLTFNGTNFAIPQTVILAAAEDPDAIDDVATITLSASGFASRNVTATAADNDALPPAITSTPSLTGVVGALYSYDAAATGNPPPTFSLLDFPPGMDIDSGNGLVTWTPAAPGTANVSVQAANGVPPAATQNFTITVSADQPPLATLTRPIEGEFVTGNASEWYGNGVDDVGTVKAEFFVDNMLVYTDTTPGDHYHFGGAHNLWDTTAVANGGRLLRLTVTDTANQTGSVEVNVIVHNGISPFQAWKIAKFTPAQLGDPNISGNHADAEPDGAENLMEYALDGNPTVSDRAEIDPVVGRNGTRLTLTFTRVLGATDITYTTEGSNDLTGSWSATGFNLTNTIPMGAKERVTYQDDAANPEGPRRFIRLQIGMPPP